MPKTPSLLPWTDHAATPRSFTASGQSARRPIETLGQCSRGSDRAMDKVKQPGEWIADPQGVVDA